jgi:hypothetical protein
MKGCCSGNLSAEALFILKNTLIPHDLSAMFQKRTAWHTNNKEPDKTGSFQLNTFISLHFKNGV